MTCFCCFLPGSPPHVRGKAGKSILACYSFRITPACAGKSRKCGPTCTLFWDHPRVCGEKASCQAWRRSGRGSPPRVRGKDGQVRICGHEIGITPACAGKSPLKGRICRYRGDHPRVCGEKLIASKRETLCTGSPPRVRGKEEEGELSARKDRITPACAGKRLWAAWKAQQEKDHPRVCGEKPNRAKTRESSTGSPPRVRGKGFTKRSAGRQPGITPACAGKSTEPAFKVRKIRDHPRVCGEKFFGPSPVFLALGSPPRVRGKGQGLKRDASGARITPACAGKRPLLQPLLDQLWGSPPRVRGKD